MSSAISIELDTSRVRSQIRAVQQGLDALSSTILGAGEGWVVTSMRRKLRHEKGRAPHGRLIAGALRKNGHDPFAYPAAVSGGVAEGMRRQVTFALEEAWKTDKPQFETIKEVLLLSANKLALWVRTNITSGHLGSRASDDKAVRIAKARAKRGLVTLEYGCPPPYGVRSGRFVKGIRGIWNSGIRKPRKRRT